MYCSNQQRQCSNGTENSISSTFEEKDIKRLPNNCYLISFQGTSAEFVNKLNLNGDPKTGATENRPCEGVFFHL